MATYNQNQMTLPNGDVINFIDNTSGYTKNTGTITDVQVNGTSIATSGIANVPVASTSTYGATKLSSATDSDAENIAATSKAVKTVMDKVEGLGSPMHWIGTIGRAGGSGTSSTIPTSGIKDGDMYKIIEENKTVPAASSATGVATTAWIGDTIVANKSLKWTVIPSGDEPSGTVTSVAIGTDTNDQIDVSGGPVTSSGTLKVSHKNSGATAGSYGDNSNQTPAYGGTFKVPFVKVNSTGHVTEVSEHTVKIPASDNTWRGIQNNLTSDSTTDSLSAAQGKALKALADAKESSSNKVTSLSSSSTDTQYPSAKCVYDLIGNVESLLEAL